MESNIWTWEKSIHKRNSKITSHIICDYLRSTIGTHYSEIARILWRRRWKNHYGISKKTHSASWQIRHNWNTSPDTKLNPRTPIQKNAHSLWFCSGQHLNKECNRHEMVANQRTRTIELWRQEEPHNFHVRRCKDLTELQKNPSLTVMHRESSERPRPMQWREML